MRARVSRCPDQKLGTRLANTIALKECLSFAVHQASLSLTKSLTEVTEGKTGVHNPLRQRKQGNWSGSIHGGRDITVDQETGGGTEADQDCNTQGLPQGDNVYHLDPSSQRFYYFSKQCHPLETKESNT